MAGSSQRYRDFNGYLREIFGERVQKISLDAGLDCPNRDGTLSRLGCLFCDRLGSGSGGMVDHRVSVREQVARAKQALGRRYGARRFIAYFQSFSNTYGPLPLLARLYHEALEDPDVVGLSVGTRPDCIDTEILNRLAAFQPEHLVWLELGLQSRHDETLRRINRGHDSACFENAARLAADRGLPVCAHVILGLPGEDHAMMMETAHFLARLPVRGVKIHLLYVLAGTPLAELYRQGGLRCLEREEYAGLAIDFLERLRPEMIVQRLTGDPPRNRLLAPAWAAEKSNNLKLIRETLEERDTWQGRLYPADGGRKPVPEPAHA